MNDREKKETNNIFLIALQGVAMSLADSVPGVSGGTIAFILGYYDRFIGAINDLFYAGKDKEKRKKAFLYLLKFMVGWILGFIVALKILSKVFENHIYIVCSLFLGFVLAAIPVIIIEEKTVLKKRARWWHIIFSLLGAAIVVLVVYLNANRDENNVINITEFGIGTGAYMLLAGAIAITAMFLPGMSGSTLMLVFGVYFQIIAGLNGVLGGDFSVVPSCICFIAGAAGGALLSVKGIRVCLDRFRSQSLFLIIGMLIGSLYAILMGPTTLKDNPMPMIALESFEIVPFIIGVVVIVGMQVTKTLISRKNVNK